MTQPLLDTPALRKSRGAYFTPAPIAEFVAQWAIEDPSDRILEPSCGEAAFLVAAAGRIRDLGGDPARAHLAGVELHDWSAQMARDVLKEAGARASVDVADFFDVEPTGDFAAVIGNPPYVRYQSHAGHDRAKSRAAALRAGVRLTRLASSWAAFTVHAAQFLRPGGRLGLVVPAELLSVNYASEVRTFLMRSFSEVRLVLFTERVFPDVQEEVVLLLASGFQQGSTDHTLNYQARNAEDLSGLLAASRWTPRRPSDKWTALLMRAGVLSKYGELLSGDAFTTLGEWGDTTLGMVTGNNSFFALSPSKVVDLGLRASDVIEISPPGSRHLRGLELSSQGLSALGAGGSSTRLFRPGQDPSKAALRYIRLGEQAGVHQAYKCLVRTPWWRVPLVNPADLFLTYMNADTPRLTTNAAGAHHLNSVHGIYLRPAVRGLGSQLLPIASLNSITMLGAEVVGRSYGGGMLKIEPREADQLPVPTPSFLAEHAELLLSLRPHVGDLLAAGQLTRAASLVDSALLVETLGIDRSDMQQISVEAARLSRRRSSRASRPGALLPRG